MIRRARADHLDAADFGVLDEKGLREQNAGGPIEARILVGRTVREHTLVHRAGRVEIELVCEIEMCVRVDRQPPARRTASTSA